MTTEYIDPDQQQTIARQNQVQQYGTIVINHKGRTERVTTNTEQDITNGIIKVVSGQQRKVYFTQGHGEKDPTSTEREGYGGIGEALKRENYIGREDRPRAAGRGARGRLARGHRRARRTISSRPRSTRSRSISTSRASCCWRSIRRTAPTRRRSPT